MTDTSSSKDTTAQDTTAKDTQSVPASRATPLPNLADKMRRPAPRSPSTGTTTTAPRPDAPSKPVNAAPVAANTRKQTERSEPQTTKRARDKSPSAGSTAERGGAGTAAVVFYLPLEQRNEVRSLVRATDVTNADVILDAIEYAMDDLEALVAKRRDLSPSKKSGFIRESRRESDTKVQITARISATNLKVIDDLQNKFGAESRTELAEIALGEYLSAKSSQRPAS